MDTPLQFKVPLSAEEQRAEIEQQKAKVLEAAQQHVRLRAGLG
jgi:hypothetical protein